MKFVRIAATAACLLLAFSFAAGAAPVRVTGGEVEGSVSHGITAYEGIPFAAPPLGDLRWKAPQPVAPWKGVKNAAAFAPACPQVQLVSKALGIPALRTSEDCLYLNIWTPAISPAAHLPVMVWIYGGGFAAGATSIPAYTGETLARKGVMVVSIAYRVGPFGFLAHPDLSRESGHGSGNYGLLDQIAALKWVHDNISGFGGDPSKVTIFGESAGAFAVSMLVASPLAHGLFARAIAESGASFAPTRRDDEGGENVYSLAHAQEMGQEFLAALGVHSIAEARKLAPDQVLKGPWVSMIIGGFWPVADGYVLPEDQYRLFESGGENHVPVLVGSNSDEGAIFPTARTATLFRSRVEAGYGAYAPKMLSAYPARSDIEAVRSAKDLFRDIAFAWPAWTWGRLQSRRGTGNIYLYYFDHHPQFPPGFPFPGAGAIHALEVGYVFGHLDMPGVTYTATDRVLTDQLSTYWTNFAKTGNPNGATVPFWPAFTQTAPRVQHFTDAARPGPVPNMEKLKTIDGYYAWRRQQRAGEALRR